MKPIGVGCAVGTVDADDEAAVVVGVVEERDGAGMQMMTAIVLRSVKDLRRSSLSFLERG